jgi:hypothetical protein
VDLPFGADVMEALWPEVPEPTPLGAEPSAVEALEAGAGPVEAARQDTESQAAASRRAQAEAALPALHALENQGVVEPQTAATAGAKRLHTNCTHLHCTVLPAAASHCSWPCSVSVLPWSPVSDGLAWDSWLLASGIHHTNMRCEFAMNQRAAQACIACARSRARSLHCGLWRQAPSQRLLHNCVVSLFMRYLCVTLTSLTVTAARPVHHQVDMGPLVSYIVLHRRHHCHRPAAAGRRRQAHDQLPGGQRQVAHGSGGPLVPHGTAAEHGTDGTQSCCSAPLRSPRQCCANHAASPTSGAIARWCFLRTTVPQQMAPTIAILSTTRCPRPAAFLNRRCWLVQRGLQQVAAARARELEIATGSWTAVRADGAAPHPGMM